MGFRSACPSTIVTICYNKNNQEWQSAKKIGGFGFRILSGFLASVGSSLGTINSRKATVKMRKNANLDSSHDPYILFYLLSY